jgi:acyl-CoA dehydrogenase
VKLSSDDLTMFFGDAYDELAAQIRAAMPALAAAEDEGDEPARDRAAVDALVRSGLWKHVLTVTGRVPALELCLIREGLGYVSARADSIFAVQGLGMFPLMSEGQRAVTRAARDGEVIAAFALTEPGAGSDVSAISTRARKDGDTWILDGEKIFISNLGVATHATVFATIDPERGRKGITAFWVPLDTAGAVVIPQQATAPHPLGRLLLSDCRIPADAIVGAPGAGFRLAMETLDTFRVSVGAAAVGMARRALDEAAAHVRTRIQFGKPLAEQPLVLAHLADMAVDLDAARLLVCRAAWLRDHPTQPGGGARVTTEVSMAKLGATEAAQRVIDRAVQLLGGSGVMVGSIVEHLYRAVRPLRIYEGTSEIQRTIIGKAVAAAAGDPPPPGRGQGVPT